MKRLLKTYILLLIAFILSNHGYTQSNIQKYTPSKLLNQGQWDVKWFNNLYTQMKFADSEGHTQDVPRSNFFTSSIDVFTGVSPSNRINIGLLAELRSNTIGGKGALTVFNFHRDKSFARSGLSSIAPAIKIQPLKNKGNLSLQSALHIPLIEEESNSDGVFLDQTAYMWQNRLFYDHTFKDGNWQIFAELSTEYNFGDEKSFANNTFVFAPGVFLSYFPSSSFTLLALVQHYQRVGDFTQDFTATGLGAKYQLSQVINIELIYTKFIRGSNSGLGETFNIGFRALL